MPTSDIVRWDEGRPPMALQDVLSSRLVAKSQQPAAATQSVYSGVLMESPLIYKTDSVCPPIDHPPHPMSGWIVRTLREEWMHQPTTLGF